MERCINRSLPYFSIGINVLLCWSMIEIGTDKAIVYGTRYASLILQFIDLALL